MTQLTLFDLINSNKEPFKFKKPIKVIELFAGYGSQMLAFEYLHANAEHFRICEWAVPSIMAYNLIHVRDFTDYSRERERENGLLIIQPKSKSLWIITSL